MKQVQRGFTLIELVMVIVILGILAAVAMPKFLDLSTKAEEAALKGVAGGLTSASAVNYAALKAGANGALTITTCVGVGGALAGGIPSEYSVVEGTSGYPNCQVRKGASGTPVDWVAIN